MASLTDILTTVQNGVTAMSAFTKQLQGSVNNISSQLNRSLTSATLQTGTLAFTGTASTIGVMMGFGGTCKITPVFSSRVDLRFQGSLSNTTNTASTTIQVKYGTGTAPATGAAIIGTSLGGVVLAQTSPANFQSPFCAGGIITGLIPGTAYWFDFYMVVSTGTGTAFNVSCSVMEF